MVVAGFLFWLIKKMGNAMMSSEIQTLAIDPTDMSRADEIRSETYVPNEIHQIATLLALQVALLHDIRFSLNELLHYKQQEVHR